jgi:hypothetical protein
VSLAPHYAAAYGSGAFGALADRYLHRAVVEDALGVTVGRDAIVAAAIATAAALEATGATVRHDGRSLGIVEIAGRRDAKAVTVREHRWSFLEGDLVVEDLLVADRAVLGLDPVALGAVHPTQPPLGELRSGEGQLWASPSSGHVGEHRELADALHQIWNGRRLDLIATLYAPTAKWVGPGRRTGGPDALRGWLTGLLARLPDATVVIDRSEVTGGRVAFLWRLFGHIAGRRARLIGSTLLTLEGGRVVADDTLIDEAALDATPHRPLLSL